ncbi:uncharacterized protein SAPINGB_P002675 [Magnusiomyces paraingens]|uniref:Hyaluronan/mRNA-binding protein domain-containing protein n=1 Tax=Magnusiomyces paraingens TaxID=2606893 RepID=A0A5E8BFE5_9ASCO|nr:uncharacterized protein SAPINGB_P002675 [Saprochaete ingens]VVT50249.1 unnamed protein product [Saprochaete ingens]
MSVASINLFAVLDEENSINPKAAGPVREVVKKTASTKKSDVNPRSNNSGSRPSKRPQYQGNEAAFRDRNAGRDANRSRPLDEKTEGGRPARRGPPRASGNRSNDRHSRSGKADTEKTVEKGWGDDKKKLDDEKAAETIAKADEESESVEAAADASAEAVATPAEPVEPEAVTKTLEEYFEELSVESAALGGPAAETRKPNEGAEDSKYQAVLKREEEDFVSASKVKAVKSKKTKEKVTLEVNPVFASSPASAPRSDRPPRRSNNNRDNRDNSSNHRAPRDRNSNNNRRQAPRAAQQQKKSAAPAAPAVNLANTDEFPTLGA